MLMLAWLCYRLQGLCDFTAYDDSFVMTGTRNGKPYFRGYFRSHIYYTKDGLWRIENIQVSLRVNISLQQRNHISAPTITTYTRSSLRSGLQCRWSGKSIVARSVHGGDIVSWLVVSHRAFFFFYSTRQFLESLGRSVVFRRACE